MRTLAMTAHLLLVVGSGFLDDPDEAEKLRVLLHQLAREAVEPFAQVDDQFRFGQFVRLGYAAAICMGTAG
jgi:hypothetical protein